MRNPIPAKDDALGTRELLLTLNKRLAFAAISGGASAAVMAVAVMAMMPLKEQVPYIIEVNKDGSAQVPAQTPAVRYTPAFESKAYFLRRWITDAFTINQYTTKQQLDPRARIMLRGSNAIGAYEDWLKVDRKFEMIAEDPTLVRDVEILSITPIAGTDGGVVADVNLTTRKGGAAVSERKLVTIYFDIFPITERKDVEVNPLGLFITDFKVGVGNAQK